MRSVVPAGTRRVVNLLPSVKTLGYLRVREQTAGRDGVCVVRIGEHEHSTSQALAHTRNAFGV
jgi:hypothetical protein